MPDLDPDFQRDPLWRLLGRASPAPAPSPGFVRNVMRQVRASVTPRDRAAGWLAWLGAGSVVRARLAIAAASLVIVAGLATWAAFGPANRIVARSDPAGEFDDAVVQMALRHFETIAQLDQLIAQAEHNVWIDGDPNL